VNVSDEVFEKHCFELETFKEEFGHCNVPTKYPDIPVLGPWCKEMITEYKNSKRE